MNTLPMKLDSLLRLGCPSCGGEDVRRAHRHSAADWMLSALALRPYRCHGCDHRFHASPALRSIAPTRRERAFRNSRPGAGKRGSARWRRPRPQAARHAMIALGALLGASVFLLFIARFSS
jgi:hypothetical protein